MSTYLVHASRERARIRDDIFENQNNKIAAMELLQKEEGIAGVKPGACSLLIFLEPEADLKKICADLEAKFPQLQKQESAPAPKTDAAAQAKARLNHRKDMVRLLFTAGVTTVGLILFGLKHAHAWAGATFAVLATNHVWERRKGL